jgi:hypothetical protein
MERNAKVVGSGRRRIGAWLAKDVAIPGKTIFLPQAFDPSELGIRVIEAEMHDCLDVWICAVGIGAKCEGWEGEQKPKGVPMTAKRMFFSRLRSPNISGEGSA